MIKYEDIVIGFMGILFIKVVVEIFKVVVVKFVRFWIWYFNMFRVCDVFIFSYGFYNVKFVFDI